MIIRTQKLQELLDKRGLTRQDFANKIGVHVGEVDQMLIGETIGYDTAKMFSLVKIIGLNITRSFSRK